MVSQVQTFKALFEKHSIENVSAQIEEITGEKIKEHNPTQIPSSDDHPAQAEEEEPVQTEDEAESEEPVQAAESEEPVKAEEEAVESEEPVQAEEEATEAEEPVKAEEESEEPVQAEEEAVESEEPVQAESVQDEETIEKESISNERYIDGQTSTNAVQETTIEDALKETKVELESPEVLPEPKRGSIEVDPTIKLNIFENAFDEEVCDKLRGIITKNMIDSTITTTVDNFRKSKTSIIDINEPLIHIVNKKICDIIGADIVRGEPIQGIHYEEGGFFKPHTDYFEANELHLCGKSGNREMTAILYVDDVTEEQEGELVFPILTKRIKPRKGMLVFWNNMRGASPLYTTLNEERILKSGFKSCLIKYIREKPFF